MSSIYYCPAPPSQQGCNGVAGTLMSNLGLELALAEMGIPFERTKVGDRYVVEAMKENLGTSAVRARVMCCAATSIALVTA